VTRYPRTCRRGCGVWHALAHLCFPCCLHGPPRRVVSLVLGGHARELAQAAPRVVDREPYRRATRRAAVVGLPTWASVGAGGSSPFAGGLFPVAEVDPVRWCAVTGILVCAYP